MTAGHATIARTSPTCQGRIPTGERVARPPERGTRGVVRDVRPRDVSASLLRSGHVLLRCPAHAGPLDIEADALACRLCDLRLRPDGGILPVLSVAAAALRPGGVLIAWALTAA